MQKVSHHPICLPLNGLLNQQRVWLSSARVWVSVDDLWKVSHTATLALLDRGSL